MERLNDRSVPWRKSSETVCTSRPASHCFTYSYCSTSTFASARRGSQFLKRYREPLVAESERRDRYDIIAMMPSPVGHALGGIAAGCAILPSTHRRFLTWFAIAGMLADLDLILPVTHRGPAHSVTAAVLAFASALAIGVWRNRPAESVRFATAIGAAYLTHVLLDWLGEDSGPPAGIMALWPFSQNFYVSGLDVFDGIERRYWLPEFWWGNLRSIVKETILLAPVTIAMVLWSRHAETRARVELE